MGLGGSLGLGIVITASDLASGTIKSVAKSFAGLDDSITKAQEKFAAKLGKGLFGGLGVEPTLAILKDLAKAASVATAGVAGLAAAFKLADNASEFEYRLAELRSTTKLTGDQVEEFHKRALAIGATAGRGPIAVSDAFRELAASTLTGDQALKALEPTLNLLNASFGRLSPEKAGGLVAKTLETFPELAGNATRAVDLLARAFKGGLKPEDIATAMDKAAKGARYMGRSLQEVLITIGGAKAAGLSIGSISLETLRATAHMEKFVRGERSMISALKDRATTAQSVADAEGATWEGLKRRVGETFETLKIALGEPLLVELKPVFKFISDAFTSLTKWAINLSPAVKTLAAKFLVFGSVALVIGGLKMALATLIPVAGAILSALGPVVVIGAAIAAGAYLIYRAWESNFGGIRDKVMPIFDGIKLAVLSLVELFTTGEISGALADELLKAENGPIYDFVEGISRLVANVKNAFTDLSAGFTETFAGVQTNFGGFFGSILGGVTTLLKAVAGVGTVVVGVLSGNMSTIMRGLAIFVNAGIDMVNGLIDKAATALVALGAQDTGVKLAGMKLDHVTAAQIAYGIGGEGSRGAELAGQLTEEDNRRASASASATAGVPSSASATGSGLPPSSGGTTLPSSRPAGSAAAQAAPDNSQLIAAITALGKRPVVVNGTVTIDGMKLADWQAKERRDRAAAAGTIHRPYHGYGHDAE